MLTLLPSYLNRIKRSKKGRGQKIQKGKMISFKRNKFIKKRQRSNWYKNFIVDLHPSPYLINILPRKLVILVWHMSRVKNLCPFHVHTCLKGIFYKILLNEVEEMKIKFFWCFRKLLLWVFYESWCSYWLWTIKKLFWNFLER